MKIVDFNCLSAVEIDGLTDSSLRGEPLPDDGPRYGEQTLSFQASLIGKAAFWKGQLGTEKTPYDAVPEADLGI